MTDTEPSDLPTPQQHPNRLLRIASKASIGLTILALIAAGATLALVAIHESDRASYWRDLFIEQCIENAQCDVEEEIESAPAPAAPAGEQGVPGPTGPRGEPGSDGDDGAPGPAGPAGPSGADGEDGAAGPIGPPGPNGLVGSSGANGVDGASGPAGPAGPAGPQGEPGAQGASGADGRGIASLMCDDAGRWQVVYTDGSTADAGQCRVDPIVTPPDPEPTDEPLIPLLP